MGISNHIRNNIVGYVALFFALSTGAAVALPGSDTVFSDDIVNGEVKQQDVATNAIGSKEVANASLNADDIANITFVPTEINKKPGSLGLLQYGLVKNAIRTGLIKDGEVTKADLAPGVVPAGPAGYGAFDDDTGIICNNGCTEGTLQNLPAGSYAIFGKITINQPISADETLIFGGCVLQAGADSDTDAFRQEGSSSGDISLSNANLETVNMQVVHTFASNGGEVDLNCNDNDVGNTTGSDLKITAIRLGSLSNVHSSSG
jgi:hypothetical protein